MSYSEYLICINKHYYYRIDIPADLRLYIFCHRGIKQRQDICCDIGKSLTMRPRLRHQVWKLQSMPKPAVNCHAVLTN